MENRDLTIQSFPCDSAGKESACNAGELGSNPGLRRSPGEGKGLPTPVFWPGEFHGLYSPGGHKESGTTERPSLSLSYREQLQFSSVAQSCLFAAPWTAAHQASLSITNSRRLLKLMSTESVMPFNHFILCHPLLLLLSIFPRIRVFSNDSVFHRL